MSGFDSTKNNIDKMKLYLKRMQYSEQSGRMPQIKDLDEHTIKQFNNDLFLPLINYILIDYSAEIYIEILDRIPDIKYKDDRKFVEDVINLSREMFKMGSILSVQQFLSNKYIDKKLEFVSTLAQTVYNRVQSNKKANKNRDKQAASITKTLQQYTKTNPTVLSQQLGLDDDDQQVPMVITAVPMKIDVQQFKNKAQPKQVPQTHTQKPITKPSSKMPLKNDRFVVNGEEFDQEQIEKALQERHPTPLNMNTRKPVEEPISISDTAKGSKSGGNYYYEQTYQEQGNEDKQYDRFRVDQNKNKVKDIPYPYHTNQHHHTQHAKHNQHQHAKHNQHQHLKHQHAGHDKKKPRPEMSSQQQSPTTTPRQPIEQQSISRSQFNELVSLIRVVSETVNQISHKFGELESNVSTQINTINARVLMLQSTVRLIKDNL